jgi:dTDP-4-amino-4,6-dideoxygalactose transaminase
MKIIPFARPLIDESDLDSVTDCLKSPQLAHGPLASKFEDSFVEFMGGGYATTTSSATTALQLAYMSLGIGPEDEVIVTSLTHVATANSIVSCGAKPVFVDINLQNGNIDTDAIEAAITPATKSYLSQSETVFS